MLFRQHGLHLRAGLLILLISSSLILNSTLGAEVRGLWVDTFHASMRNSNEVAQLVADAKAARFNTLFVEVRKRCDAYYNSQFEPKASDVVPQDYDPLADLLTRAHAQNPPMEVFAWMTTYLAWNNKTLPPSQPDHPFRKHRDWLTQDYNGRAWDGQNYQFDAALPAVQHHVFNVAMDLVAHYDIDGLQFDYVRYSGNTWGYHPGAMQRYHKLTGRSGIPQPTNSAWMQFRRDQVTALVRKIYLSAIEIKPRMKLSAATICWAPGVLTDMEFEEKSAAWKNVLQDWRSWMQEGIIDLNVPMAYFREKTYGKDWALWNRFIKNHQYNRHAAPGVGTYLNSAPDSLAQLASTRTPTPEGMTAMGSAVYSYAGFGTNLNKAQFTAALTLPSSYFSGQEPLFAKEAPIPPMPWKQTPTTGHLKGYITFTDNAHAVDGATITLQGPSLRATRSDATGFYGFVDLPPGVYSAVLSFPNKHGQTNSVTITNGIVANLHFLL